MSTNLEELKELILTYARDIHSDMVIDHAISSRNLGVVQDADGYARIAGFYSGTMETWLKGNTYIIAGAIFITDGYGTSVVSGSITTEIAEDKTNGESPKITHCDMLGVLGVLPDESKHSALLTTNTLKAAIRDYITTKREPGKGANQKY